MQHGILPWYIVEVKQALTAAFRYRNVIQILRLSADLGHYLADANVPLHTTENHDGQLTQQEGIHGLWESRLPELFFGSYNLFTGPAEYVDCPQQRAWKAVYAAHSLVKDVLRVERELSNQFPPTEKYSFEQKGRTLRKGHSVAYATAYHTLLQGQVEQQLRASIKMVGDFWMTCWIDAGRPSLQLLLQQPSPGDKKELFLKKLRPRRCRKD